jgi:signal transduction histidine kinase/phage shock protein PspC (stress-responsive transcriptional regulator)
MDQRDASAEAGPGRWLGARLPLPRVARSGDDRIVAGVAGGLGAALGADATLVRLVFAILALAGGSGIAIYLGAWLLMHPPERPDLAPRPGARMLGLAFTVFGVVLAIRGLGVPDRLLWPAAVAAAGAAIIWRRGGSRWPLLLGVALALAGVALLASVGIGIFTFGGAPFAPGAVAIVLLAVVGPWLWRLARERDAERLERIRTQEREEMAARVHDSVLQTLTLIQRHAGDGRRVGALARQQERELRGWLYGDPARTAGGTLAAAIDRAAAEIEERHEVRVEVVSAGDLPFDPALDALVLAAREAMTNAAKFSGAREISVYVEAGADRVSVFVRDRGAGFDRAAVPPDRRGLAESIEGRMARHGGSATIVSAPGEGTEVELTMPREAG